MLQYEIILEAKASRNRHSVFITAPNRDIAVDQIFRKYPSACFIYRGIIKTYPAHHIWTEIDASEATLEEGIK